MNLRTKIIITLLAGLLGLSGLVQAQTPGDPIVKMDIKSEVELDLGLMMEEMLPLLIKAIGSEDPESVEMAQFFLDLVGFNALQTLKIESREKKDHSTSKMLITLDPEDKDGLIYQFYNIPNGKCNFNRYVNKDELVMFMTVHNFPAYLNIILDFMAKPEIAGLMGEMPVDENGDLVLGNFTPRSDLLPLLSGELDFFVMDSPEDEPASLLSTPIFLVLGSTDGFALRDKILEIVGIMGGEAGGGIAEMVESSEPETVGDFELMELPIGGSLAVSEDFLVIGLSPGKMKEMLTAQKGDLKVPSGLEWVYVNGPKYGQYIDSAMEMAGMMALEDNHETKWMMQFYDVLFNHIETEEILYRNVSNGLEITAEVKGPVTTGLYRMVYFMLEELPALIEMEKMKNDRKDALSMYQDAIYTLDAAMMVYAEEHNGTYPEDPMQLLEQEYIEVFPLDEAVPAGEYREGCYTYHTLLDESGAVVGYYLFAYGAGQDDGFDVYTPENIAAEGNFQIGRDGIVDGVASFCYDGTALEQAEIYFGN